MTRKSARLRMIVGYPNRAPSQPYITAGSIDKNACYELSQTKLRDEQLSGEISYHRRQNRVLTNSDQSITPGRLPNMLEY